MAVRLSMAEARRMGMRPLAPKGKAAKRAAGAPVFEDAAAAMASRPAALTLSIELPPSANKSWRPGVLKTGVPAMFKRGPFKDWLEAAAFAVQAQRRGFRADGPYALRIAIGLGAGGGDGDNRVKALGDALQRGGAVANDKHMRRLVLDVDSSGNCRIATVEVWALASLPVAEGDAGRGAFPGNRTGREGVSAPCTGPDHDGPTGGATDG